MHQRYKGLIALAATTVLLALPASAATINVDPGASGSDTPGCGTVVTPCKTIQYAIDNSASNGDVIQLIAAVYAESVTILKEVTIAGVAGSILRPPVASEHGFRIAANNVTINAVNIDGTTAAATMWSGVMIFGAFTGATISNNEIHSFTGTNPLSTWGNNTANPIRYSFGIWTLGGGTTGSRDTISGLTITGNNIHDLGTATTIGGVGMYLRSIFGASAGAGATVQGNTIDEMELGPSLTAGIEHTFRGIGIAVLQDDDLNETDSGVQIGGNTAGQGNTYGNGLGTDMEIGVVVQTTNSNVDEDNSNFGSLVEVFVINQPHPNISGGSVLGVVDENQLDPFVKSTETDITGSAGVGVAGTVGYFRALGDAVANSGSGAELDVQGAGPTGGSPISAGITEAAGTITIDFGGGNTFTVSKALLEASGLPLVIEGTDGADGVTVSPAAVPAPPSSLQYNGGSGNDLLTISAGGSFTSYVHTTDPSCGEPECGDFEFDGGSTIVYTGLEPVTDLTVVASKTFTFTAADETITIVTDPAAAARTLIDSATMEAVSFVNPTATLTVNAGDGADTIDFDGLGSSSAGTLTSVVLNGEAGEDSLVIDPVLAATYPALTMAANGGTPTTCLGDLLDFVLAGGQTVAFAPSPPADGTATFAGTLDVSVTYTGIERFADEPADLAVTSVTLDDDDLFPGDNALVTVVVTNNGTNTAQCIQVDLSTFPSVLNIDEDNSLAGFDPTVTAGTFDRTTKIWSIPSLAVSASETLTIPFVVDTQLGGPFTITATISAGNEDGTPGNNTGSDGLTINTPFTFPAKGHAISAAFKTLDSGLERMLLGTFLGSPGINGAVWCRVPDSDQDALNLSGVPELYRVCSDGLPSVSGSFLPLHVNDLWMDDDGTNAGRFWMTTWGSDGLFYSTDDGETWIPSEPDLGDGFGGSSGWVNVYSIIEDEANDNILFISANNGLVFRSLNGGTTWQQVSSLPEGPADTAWSLASHPSTTGNGGIIYAGTAGKGVYVSTDFGISWSEIPFNATLLAADAGYIFDIETRSFTLPSVDYIYVATSRGVWRKDLDAAANWEELDTDQDMLTPTGLNPEVRSIEFGSDTGGDGQPDLYAVTWGFGVLRHETPRDATLTAGDLNQFALRGSEMTFFAISPGGTIYAGTNDGAMYEMDADNPVLGSVTSVDPVTDLPTDYALEQNYPNPFNPVTSIGFDLPESGEINLAVYDILGRQVAVLASGALSAGRHEVQFDASGLPSGTYFYRLDAPEVSITRHMVLLK